MASADLNIHPDAGVLNVLLSNHRKFLAFLEPRVGTPQDAEEILQSAFGKVLKSEPPIKDEKAVAWFFRLLRNSLTDYYRRQAVEKRALTHLGDIEAVREQSMRDLERTVCECLGELIPTLKPEYAELLKRIELDGASVQVTAAELGISANNAAVRLHRARLALKGRLEECCRTCASHGCFDCTCKDC